MRFGDLSALSEFDVLGGIEFEQAIAALFRRLGLEVEETDYYDSGADLVVVRDGIRTAVRVKRAQRYARRQAVQAVVAAKAVYNCDAAMVVTNRAFTLQAQHLAEANGVELWGRVELTNAILSFCAECEEPVSEGVTAYCVERRREFGGRIYCPEHQRDAAALRRSA